MNMLIQDDFIRFCLTIAYLDLIMCLIKLLNRVIIKAKNIDYRIMFSGKSLHDFILFLNHSVLIHNHDEEKRNVSRTVS